MHKIMHVINTVICIF